MKVLLINGSPHSEGCTFTALSEIAETLKKQDIEAEIFHIGNKPVPGCTACMACRKTGKCVYDDGVNEISARLDEFDGIILGSPVYYSGPSGQICAFCDRLFVSSSRRMAGKTGAAVVSCRRGGATASFDRLNKYFSISNMYIAGSQYWNMVHGSGPEDVRKDEEGMQTMRTLALNIAWLLKCIEAGKKSGIKRPEYEPVKMTNFIR